MVRRHVRRREQPAAVCDLALERTNRISDNIFHVTQRRIIVKGVRDIYILWRSTAIECLKWSTDVLKEFTYTRSIKPKFIHNLGEYLMFTLLLKYIRQNQYKNVAVF